MFANFFNVIMFDFELQWMWPNRICWFLHLIPDSTVPANFFLRLDLFRMGLIYWEMASVQTLCYNLNSRLKSVHICTLTLNVTQVNGMREVTERSCSQHNAISTRCHLGYKHIRVALNFWSNNLLPAIMPFAKMLRLHDIFHTVSAWLLLSCLWCCIPQLVS